MDRLRTESDEYLNILFIKCSIENAEAWRNTIHIYPLLNEYQLMKNILNIVAPFCILVSSTYATFFESSDHLDQYVFTDQIPTLGDFAAQAGEWMTVSFQLEGDAHVGAGRSSEAGKAWSFSWEDSGVSLSSHAQLRSIVVTAGVGTDLNEPSFREADAPTIRAVVELLELQLNRELKNADAASVGLTGASATRSQEIEGT